MELFVIAIVVVALGAPFVAIIVAAALASRVSELERRLVGMSARLELVSAVQGRLATREIWPGVVEPAGAPAPATAARPAAVPPPRAAAPEAPRSDLLDPPAPPVPPPPSPSPPRLEAMPPSPLAWEQWLGIRGAASLGAAVLVLAGIYFFQYSVEQGLIGPGLRVALGALAGLGCIAFGELWLRKRHALLASSIVGAGVALAYLTAWAASAQYGLIHHYVAAGCMIAITALCCWLSVVRRSAAIAIFGLVGGFITPLLVSRGSDAPVALFAYLLLLDAALLYVAHVRRSPLLAVTSLLGTAAYQAAWIVERMGADRVGWGMALSIGFALLYAVASGGRRDAPRDDVGWSLTRGAAVLLPFAFALYAGWSSELDLSFGALAAYLGLLVAGGLLIARRDDVPWLGLAASSAALGILGAWLFDHPIEPMVLLPLVMIGALVLGAAELEARGGPLSTETMMAGLSWNAGATLLSAVAAANHHLAWPFIAAWLALALFGLRLGRLAGRGYLPAIFGAALGLGVLALAAGRDGPAPGGLGLELATTTLAAAGVLYAASRLSRERSATAIATMVACLALLAFTLPLGVSSAAQLALVALAAGLVVAGVRRHGGVTWLCAANLAAVIAAGAAWLTTGDHAVGYLAQLVIAAIFCAAPLAVDAPPPEARAHLRAAAAAPLLAAGPLCLVHLELFGRESLGLGLLGLVALPAALAVALARLERPRRDAYVWLGGAAIILVTVALPLLLDRTALLVAWSLEGLALLALYRRLDHRGLAIAGVLVMALVGARLVDVPDVLTHYPRSDVPFANWLAVSYLVPAASFALGWRWLGDRRLPAWPGRLLAAAAIAATFAWLNLAIVDAHAETAFLSLTLERSPARDLTLSLAWALFALGMLALGTWRESKALRVASLVAVLATCGKVFLADLAHLEDLQRVVSLVALALSLITVSFAYQRFVFAERREVAAPEITSA